MERLGFAIIGCGRISGKHVEAVVNNHKEAVLAAVCDIVEASAQAKAAEYVKYAEKQGVAADIPAVYTNYREALKDPAVQIVTIATESGKHAEIALEAMKAGKHVIVEKPMALSTVDADKMIRVAREMNVKLCVSHQNRFNPSAQRLRQAVEEGRFGRIIAGNARILWNRNEDYYRQAPWRGTYAQDGGCLMNQCIHNIDLLQWMLGGEIESIHGMLGNYTHPYLEAEDYGSIQIRFKSGAIGNVEGTVCVYPKNLEETLTIIGEKGTVVLGGTAINKVQVWQFADQSDTLEEIRRECDQEIENVYGYGHTPLFQEVIDSIRQGKKILIDGTEGKKAMQIILCAYQSNQVKGAVTFDRKIQTLDLIKK